MKLKVALGAVIACLALVLPGAAMAEVSPTQDAYSGVAGQQENGGNNGGPSGESGTEANTTSPTVEAVATESPAPVVQSETTETSSGSLPFTGLEVGIMALVALGLIAGGALLFRGTRREHPIA